MSGSLFVSPRFVAVDAAGHPLPGAKLAFYVAGSTSVYAPTFTTATLGVAHPNPLTASATGMFPAIYLNTNADYDYRAVLTTAGGVLVWVEDNIPPNSTFVSTGQGPTGENGTSVAEVSIYLRSDTTPSQPTGGSFDFSTQTLTTPANWYSSVPAGSAPVWCARAVAASDNPTGIDYILAWSAPVRVLADGSSVDIIFRRAASLPSTPAPSSVTPAGWYTNVEDAVGVDLLWSSIGTRPHAGLDWIWQLPIQVEGDVGATGPQGPTGPTGATGADATLYYIKPTDGTAIKNGAGSLTIEGHKVIGGTDSLLAAGTIKLYAGATVVTEANGFAVPSDGYTGTFDTGDIAGSVVVSLRDGPVGTVYDTITLVDVADGEADTGKNAVYGYIEASNGLAFTRASDQTTWSPAGATTQLDATFVQGGVEVARVAWVITRDSSGILTGASGTHAGGDLNSARVTTTEINETTRAMTVKFFYANAGDEAAVVETVLTSMAGSDGAGGADGADGADGAAAITLRLTKRSIPLMSYQNGSVVSYADAYGYATVWEGSTEVTAAAMLSATATGCSGTVNTSDYTPVLTFAKGYYEVTAVSTDTSTLKLTAVYDGKTVEEFVTISRSFVGYQIVGALPSSGNFQGRMVFLSTDNKLYRWTSATTTGTTFWSKAVDGADIQANSILTNSIGAGQITAAKIGVTQLSALTVDAGDIKAGILRSPSATAYSSSTFDLSNSRIVFDTAPGLTGGYVRVTGGGFGPAGVYLDWYGPKPPGEFNHGGIVANLTDAAALWFLKTDGTQYSRRGRGEFEPKAWANFNGLTTGNNAVQTIRDRFNIASITRVGTSIGRYQVTFSSGLANTNYVAVITGASDLTGGNAQICCHFDPQKTGFKIGTKTAAGNAVNCELLTFMIYGSSVIDGSNVTVPTGGFGGGSWGGGNLP